MAFTELKIFLHRSVNSTIGRNVLSLYTLQFANYILPLIAVPYLVRVLGPEKFGAVAFGQSFMMYFVLLVNYGFNWSATRTISVQRDDPQKVSKTASAVLGAKVLLTMVSLGILSLLVAVVPKFREMSALLYLLFGIVIGNALFPQWLFQGLERMIAISAINLSMRVLAVAGIFILVHQPADYLKYAGLLGFQWVGAGVAGLIWAWLGLRVKPVIPDLSEIIKVLKEGRILFLSQASVSLYTVGNAFILGLLTNPTVVGYYSAAERIVLSLSGLMGPIAQAVYPRFSKVASESEQTILQLGRKVLVLMGSMGMLLTFMLVITAPVVTEVLLGGSFERSIAVMRILAPWIFINGVTNVWGIQIMIPCGYDIGFFTILLLAGLLNIVLAIPLATHWNEIGMATSVLLSCIFVTVAQPAYLWGKARITPWLSKK